MATQNSEQEKNYTAEEIYSMGLWMAEKLKAAKEEQKESEIIEVFMLNEDDRDERLKAHYRQGKIIEGVWVNDPEEE